MKPKLTFAINSNILLGGGGERTLVHYLISLDGKYLENYEIVVIQTGYYDRERMEPGFIQMIPKEVKLITVENYESRIKFLKDNRRNVLIFLYRILLQPILEMKNIKFLVKELSSSDIVYLFHNGFSKYVRSPQTLVVGSFHEWQPNAVTLIGRAGVYLVKSGLIFRRINLYHSLTGVALNYLPSAKKAKSFVVPNGIDPQIFHTKPENRSPSNLTILFVARLLPCKGLELAAESVMKFIQSGGNAEFHVVGTGEQEHLFSGRNYQWIKYHGNVATKELVELYNSSDVFIYPSRCDNFGLVIIEALACGTYAIIDDSFRGFFPDLEKLKYVELCNHAATSFSNSLKDAASRIEEIRARRKEVSLYVRNNYDWDSVTKKLLEKIIKDN